MAQEILDVLVERNFSSGVNGGIRLADLDIEPYEIKPDHQVKSLRLNPNGFIGGPSKELKDVCQSVVEEAIRQGYDSRIFTGIYEAVLNAYQHGNNKDPNKPVTIAFKLSDTQLDVVVIDKGGYLDNNFIKFALQHREGKHKEHFLNFYSVFGIPNPPGNNGTGTSFIYTYFDRVEYYKYEPGGLAVKLTKFRK